MVKKTVVKTSIRGLDADYQSYQTTTKKKINSGLRNVNINTLYETLKKSPEVVACISAIVEDIMSDGWRYEGSKNAISKAQDFEIKSNLFKLITNAIIDILVTGNAYILKLSVSQDKIDELLRSIPIEMIEKQKLQVSEIKDKLLKQEDMFKPKDLQLLKSSTIEIKYKNDGSVDYYEQTVENEKRIYQPKDIMHLSLFNLGGTVYGFTPLETLLSDIATLIFAKEFAGKYFENDGLPSWMFNLPEANGEDDRNFQVLKSQLQSLKKKENKFRTLITTGKIESKEIEKFKKDMQFKELIQHFTQVVLIGMGVPTYRLSWTANIQTSSTESAKAFEGYFKKINFIQKIIEAQLNKELFEGFNVSLKFNRSYKIDELREANIVTMLIDRQIITVEEARKMMGLEEDRPKGTLPEKRQPDQNSYFDENKDKRNSQGNDKDSMTDNSAPEYKDKQTKSLVKEFLEELHIKSI